jgi:hypothetical protein
LLFLPSLSLFLTALCLECHLQVALDAISKDSDLARGSFLFMDARQLR